MQQSRQRIPLARYAEVGRPEDADTLVQPLNPRRDNTIGAFREAVTRADRMISRKYGD